MVASSINPPPVESTSRTMKYSVMGFSQFVFIVEFELDRVVLPSPIQKEAIPKSFVVTDYVS